MIRTSAPIHSLEPRRESRNTGTRDHQLWLARAKRRQRERSGAGRSLALQTTACHGQQRGSLRTALTQRAVRGTAAGSSVLRPNSRPLRNPRHATARAWRLGDARLGLCRGGRRMQRRWGRQPLCSRVHGLWPLLDSQRDSGRRCRAPRTTAGSCKCMVGGRSGTAVAWTGFGKASAQVGRVVAT